MSPSSDIDVTSAGAAFTRQAAAEAHLLIEAEAMMRRFLAGVLSVASSGSIYPPDVTRLWGEGVAELLEAIPEEMASYVAESFTAETIPDDVYTTAVAVLNAAVQTYAPIEETRQRLARALSPDGFEVEQISASIGQDLMLGIPTYTLYPHIVHDEDPRSLELLDAGIVAAGFWDSLQETGSVWIKRIRRTVRTSATGMVSRFTVTAIRLQDYPMKRWVTRHDDHVRHSHRLANGQTVPVDQPFQVGGFSLMYPGAKDAEYGEIVNCRCVLIGVK